MNRLCRLSVFMFFGGSLFFFNSWILANEWTPSNSEGQAWEPQNPAGQVYEPRNTGGRSAGIVDKPEVGSKVYERNKEIRDSRKNLEKLIETKGYDSKEFKEASEKLEKLRKERDEFVEQLPEGQGMRYKMRRSMGADRIHERKEQEAYQIYQKNKEKRILTPKEEKELEEEKKAAQEDKEKPTASEENLENESIETNIESESKTEQLLEEGEGLPRD